MSDRGGPERNQVSLRISRHGPIHHAMGYPIGARARAFSRSCATRRKARARDQRTGSGTSCSFSEGSIKNGATVPAWCLAAEPSMVSRSLGERMASSSTTRRWVSSGYFDKALSPARARPPPKPRFFLGERNSTGREEGWGAARVAGSGPLSVTITAIGRRVCRCRESSNRERRSARKRVATRATTLGASGMHS